MGKKVGTAAYAAPEVVIVKFLEDVICTSGDAKGSWVDDFYGAGDFE